MTQERQWAFEAACNLLSAQFVGFTIVAVATDDELSEDEEAEFEVLRCEWGMQLEEPNQN